MTPATEWEALILEAMKDRRRGRRVPLAFPIEVSGFDRTGRLFCERTTTTDISEDGCRIRMKIQLERGDVVAIKLRSRRNDQEAESKPLLFQIVWIAREGGAWTAGALKLQAENIWHLAFPSTNRPKQSTP